jgi:predicted ferric reductase
MKESLPPASSSNLSFEERIALLINKWESYFLNHGVHITVAAIFIHTNVIMFIWGVSLFTPPHWRTSSDILRVTLPIARGAGRVCTWNIALLLLSACKYWWTMVRTKIPIVCAVFPVDNIMPYYHRATAQILIVAGGIVHTIPQVVNYATQALVISSDLSAWNFGDGLATLSLLVSGILLFITIVLLALSTHKSSRKTTSGFRWFWNIHLVASIATIPLFMVHGTYRGTPITTYFIYPPLFLYIADVFLRRYQFVVDDRAKLVKIIPHRDEDDKVVELAIQCSASTSTAESDFRYTPGQYAEIKIPALSAHEWHPFTIASSPAVSVAGDEDNNGECVLFYIKASGRWTNALYDQAILLSRSEKDDKTDSDAPLNVMIDGGGADKGVDVLIRGPFGAPAQNYFMYQHIVVIGSGIGVTPLLSIWKHLVHVYQCSDSGQAEPAAMDIPKVLSSFEATQLAGPSRRLSINRGAHLPINAELSREAAMLTRVQQTYGYAQVQTNFNPGEYLPTAGGPSWGAPFSNQPTNHKARLPIDAEEDRLLHDLDLGYVSVQNFDRVLRRVVHPQDLETIKSSPPGAALTASQKDRHSRVLLAFYATVLESMTVNIVTFIFALTDLTVVFGCWMYNLNKASSLLPALTSSLTFLFFSCKIILLSLAYGMRYIRSTLFLLEISIAILDGISLIAAILSIPTSAAIHFFAYFVFFAAYLLVQLVRTFHIFYVNSRPISEKQDLAIATSRTKDSKGVTHCKFRTVTGIWVSRNYSSMSFAADDLVKTIRNLPDIFSLRLYATRDKQSHLDQVDPFKKEDGESHSSLNVHRLVGGRPDWDEILREAVESAVDTDDKQESMQSTSAQAMDERQTVIGVFFCGAPAISAALQMSAQRVVAEYRYQTGRKCRILVHSENF